MPGLLTHMTADFDRRLKLRRQMLHRLGIAPRQEMASALVEASRDTLRCCTQCRNTDACEVWFDQGAPGTPAFCSGQKAFGRLDAALNPKPRLKEEARSEVRDPPLERRSAR